MEYIAIAQKYNIYVNQAMISNTTLDSKKNIVQETMNSEVTVSNNSEVIVINIAGQRHETNFPTEGVSNVNNWLNIKIIKNTKEDKNKVCNVSKKYIIKYTHTHVYSVDMISIIDSKISGTTLVTTDCNRNSISSNEELLNKKCLCEIEQ